MIVFVGVPGVAFCPGSKGLLLCITYVVVVGIAADDTITFEPVVETAEGSCPIAGIDEVLAIVVAPRAAEGMPTLANVVVICLLADCSFGFCDNGDVFICVTPGNRGVVLIG